MREGPGCRHQIPSFWRVGFICCQQRGGFGLQSFCLLSLAGCLNCKLLALIWGLRLKAPPGGLSGDYQDPSPPCAQRLKSDPNQTPLGKSPGQASPLLFGSAPRSTGLSSAVSWRACLGDTPPGRLGPRSCVLQHQWGKQSQKDGIYRHCKQHLEPNPGQVPVAAPTGWSCPGKLRCHSSHSHQRALPNTTSALPCEKPSMAPGSHWLLG